MQRLRGRRAHHRSRRCEANAGVRAQSVLVTDTDGTASATDRRLLRRSRGDALPLLYQSRYPTLTNDAVSAYRYCLANPGSPHVYESCRGNLIVRPPWTPPPPPGPPLPSGQFSVYGTDVGAPYDADAALKQLDAAIKKQQDALKAKPGDDTSARPSKSASLCRSRPVSPRSAPRCARPDALCSLMSCEE